MGLFFAIEGPAPHPNEGVCAGADGPGMGVDPSPVTRRLIATDPSTITKLRLGRNTPY